MNGDHSDRRLRWRCGVVDVLIGASALAMVLAATDAAAGHGYLLPTLASVAILGVALTVEPGDFASVKPGRGERWQAVRSLRGRLGALWHANWTT